MTSITITLSDEQSQKVQQTADELGISPEELLRASLEELLTRPNTEFVQAVNYVMKKMLNCIVDWHDRYLTLTEVLELHRRIIEQSGGTVGLRDLGALESAIAQPRMTFGGIELYPTIVEVSRMAIAAGQVELVLLA